MLSQQSQQSLIKCTMSCWQVGAPMTKGSLGCSQHKGLTAQLAARKHLHEVDYQMPSYLQCC